MLTGRQALVEAERCLMCFDAPCAHACPTHIAIPTFIAMIGSGNVRGAAEVVKSANPLANVCGEVCPEEVFCQASCTRAKQDAPVAIRELHAFATAEEARLGYSRPAPFPDGGAPVAVVGAGPAGLGCAFELARLGHRAHVFEAGEAGGVPRASIPEFRLASAALARDLDFLLPFVTLHRERVDPARLEALRAEYGAVFLACGLGRDRRLNVPGEPLPGVVPVLPFLERAKQGAAVVTPGARVVVIGGGNVSLDAAATAARAGAAHVTLVYRRSEREMRVWRSELEEARRHGVEMCFLAAPLAVLGDTHATAVRCGRMALTDERDASGRRVPRLVPGGTFDLPADLVIVAIGQEIRQELPAELGRTAQGQVRVDPEHHTSLPGLFAGGDAISGEGTIVQSVAHGRAAAHAIHRWLQGDRS